MPRPQRTSQARPASQRAAKKAIVFQRLSCLRRAVYDGVAYWLDTLPDLDGNIRVTCTAVVGKTRRLRVGQWTQASALHDEVHARGLIFRRHAEVVKQLSARVTA